MPSVRGLWMRGHSARLWTGLAYEVRYIAVSRLRDVWNGPIEDRGGAACVKVPLLLHSRTSIVPAIRSAII